MELNADQRGISYRDTWDKIMRGRSLYIHDDLGIYSTNNEKNVGDLSGLSVIIDGVSYTGLDNRLSLYRN